ncbi:hypothetical protein [Arenimonas sp. MALMAid1274]|uniref:hypothetical protein n=1 Tax=Arenimonas sp. MALMAid1274 TaxID=3411630 RepID=UPI003BA28575
MGFKLVFTEEQLRQLRSSQRPKLDSEGQPVLSRGKATLEPNPDGAPWRCLVGNDGAPKGFGIYVGKTKATYEVQRRINGRVMRFTIGDAGELSLEAAQLRALELMVQSKKKDAHPRVVQRDELSTQAIRRLTVNGAIELYHDMLARRARPAREGTLKMLKNAKARLDRPEVGLGQVALKDLAEAQVITAFEATRLSAALRSNRLTGPIKLYMKSVQRVELTDDELRQLGVKSDAMRERIRAAGVSAAEQTFASASRAVRYVLDKEARQAKSANRPPLLVGNDFQVLWEEGRMRDAKALQDYYQKARVRNPLGQEDNTLGQAIEYLWGRRVAQKGQNESGVYYLLTTLFLGARRNETAQLAWYDRVPEDQRQNVSWVWLDSMDPAAKREGRPAINPTTKKTGPQVLFAKTKNRRDHNMPLGPFSVALLRQRFERRLPEDDARARWVYPARSQRAKDGHYKDSKAIMRGLGNQLPVEFGPTPHDLRRTLGRYAGKLQIPDRITSRLFNHLPPRAEDEDAGSKSSQRYQEPEWTELQEALQRVEKLMASSAPAFFNELAPADWPPLPVVPRK